MSTITRETPGEKIRQLRLTYGLTQAEVAAAVKYNLRSYARIEADELEPKVGVALKIAKLFRTEVPAIWD